MQMQKLVVSEFKEENKILYKDLNSIADLNLREFTRNEQLRIMQKRTQGQRSQNNSDGFGQYFNILKGSGNNFLKYYVFFLVYVLFLFFSMLY